MSEARRGFTLIESVVAITVASVVLYGGIASFRFFTRPTAKYEVSLDQLKELQLGAEALDRDLRDARQIIFPTPGAAPARFVYFRNFEGFICAYYYAPARRELRRVTFDLGGLPTEPRRPPASDLDGAWFSVSNVGLVSWGLFGPDRGLVGSVKRVNQ